MRPQALIGWAGVLLGAGIGGAVDSGHVADTIYSRQLGLARTPYNIELRAADLKEGLRFLATVSGMNLVIPEDIKGTINISLDRTPILDAVNAITKSNGLDYAVERGILRVGKAESFSTNGEDLKAETIRLKYAVSKDMVDKVKQLLTPRGSVLADERTNSLVVRETLANIDNVRAFVENVDVRDAQVLIEGKIVEASRDWTRNLGIQWGVNMANRGANVTGVQQAGVAPSGRPLIVNMPAQTPNSGIGLLVGALGGDLNIDVAITAAESKGDLHVISEPSIVTSNGVPAHIRSGETIYVKTAVTTTGGGAAAAGSTGLQSIKTGVELSVTPQISVGDYIKMSVNAVTSTPDFTRTVDGIPAIVDNTATTTVLVQNGETTVIGGLIRLRGQITRGKVPFLGDLPLLGYIFQSKQRAKTNSDLIIFIRPRIVRDETVESPLQQQLPAVESVQRKITLEDDEHLGKAPKHLRAYRPEGKGTRRYQHKYERE